MSVRQVSVCWWPGNVSFQAPAGDGSCPVGSISYQGPLREEDLGNGPEIMMVWDETLTPPAPRPMTDAEVLAEARRRKLTSLNAEWTEHYNAEFDAATIALGNAGALSPSDQSAYLDRLGSLGAALSAARESASSASSIESLDSIHVIWPPEE